MNVPGPLLADAAPEAVSGAVLASGQTFDWAYAAPAFAAVSGTFTATPAAPTVALTAAEQATFAEMTANFRGAPATRMVSLVKGVGVAGAVVLSYSIGTTIGNNAAGNIVKLWGADADGSVCSAAAGLGQTALSLLTGADCTEYNAMVEEFQANTDVSPNVDGGTSCTPSGDCLDFVVEELLQFTAPWGNSNPSQWQSNRFWCLSQSNTSATSYVSYLTDEGVVQTVANVWPTTNRAYKNLATCSGNRFLAIGSTSTSSPYPPFKDVPLAWVYNPAGGYAATVACLNQTGPCTGGSLTIPEVTIEDIVRTLACTIVGSDGITYTATSETFTEGSGSLPPIVCPQLPAGVTVASLTLTEEGGDTSFVLLQQDATDAYVHWWETYPECANGSCLLDLRQNGDSCFASGIDCDGWFTAPDRDSTYTCRYGTHTIALAGCYVYATVFSPTHQEEGTAYADPTTGNSVQTPTSPTKVERLTMRLLERDWLEYGPTQGGFVFGATDPYVAAVAVAQACIAVHAEDECEDLAIFAPGDDVREAAQHDLDAITANPAWAQLTYGDADPPVQSGWYSGTAPCVSGSYDSEWYQCDEYPFASTQQGGPGSSLRVVDKWDNGREGTYLGLFYLLCGLGQGDPFLVIPTPTTSPVEVTATAAWCVPG